MTKGSGKISKRPFKSGLSRHRNAGKYFHLRSDTRCLLYFHRKAFICKAGLLIEISLDRVHCLERNMKSRLVKIHLYLAK